MNSAELSKHIYLCFFVLDSIDHIVSLATTLNTTISFRS